MARSVLLRHQICRFASSACTPSPRKISIAECDKGCAEIHIRASNYSRKLNIAPLPSLFQTGCPIKVYAGQIWPETISDSQRSSFEIVPILFLEVPVLNKLLVFLSNATFQFLVTGLGCIVMYNLARTVILLRWQSTCRCNLSVGRSIFQLWGQCSMTS